MPGNKPSIVFVPGAWHGPETWGKLMSILEAKYQFKCTAVTLPSTTSDPAATLKDDIDATREAIVGETSQGHDVVVAMHSYGGIPGQSGIKGLTLPKDATSSTTDKQGHVIGIIIMASGFIVPGKSFLDATGGQPPPTWILNRETGYAQITGDARDMFYHDLPEAEAKEWVGKLRNHSLKTLTEGGEHTYAGWTDVPSFFVATQQDHSLPIDMQRMFVQIARDAGADVTLREIDSSHSPMLSRPEETAEIVVEAVKAFER